MGEALERRWRGGGEGRKGGGEIRKRRGPG